MFAVDIEGRGRSAIRNGIVSIGICVRVGGLIMKQRINVMPYPGQNMEERCWEEFWLKNPGLHSELCQNAVPPAEAMRLFRAAMDEWKNVYIVCDAPTYDFHFLNYYLDREGLPLLQFDSAGEFRVTHDSDSYARGFMKMPFSKPWVSNKDLARDLKLPPLTVSLKPHAPEDDAHGILHAHVSLVEHK